MLILIIAVIVGIIVWAIMSLPKDLPSTDSSVNAINNIYHWLGAKLGPNWPIVLSIIVILLVVVLGLFITDLSSVTLDETTASMITKFVAVLTMGVAALLTWQWRTNYIQNPTTEYYIELSIIALLLGLNGYLLWGR